MNPHETLQFEFAVTLDRKGPYGLIAITEGRVLCVASVMMRTRLVWSMSRPGVWAEHGEGRHKCLVTVHADDGRAAQVHVFGPMIAEQIVYKLPAPGEAAR